MDMFESIIRMKDLVDQDIVEDRIEDLLDIEDFSTPSKRKRLVEESFIKMREAYSSIGRIGGPVHEKQRKIAILHAIEKAVKLCEGQNVLTPEKEFVFFETMGFFTYEGLEEAENIPVAAALWILDELRMSGKLGEAFRFLPSSMDGIWDIWMPTDLYHPCYDNDLIQSVAHAVSMSNSREKEAEQFRALMGLLDPEKVSAAVDRFHSLQWKAIEAAMKGEGLFDREAMRLIDELKSLRIENALVVLPARGMDSTEKKKELLKQFLDNDDARRQFHIHFEKLFGNGERKILGFRQLGRLMDVPVQDPYEICFAMEYLLGMDDESIWLMRSGTTAVKAACRLLPWHGFDEDSHLDEDSPDREDKDEDDWDVGAMTFNGNGWLDREAPPENTDIYRLDSPGGKNAAQRIYALSRGIVPVGMHPFSAERESMKEENVEHADLIADWSEILFLASFQAPASNFALGRWSWDPEEEADDIEEKADSNSDDKEGSLPSAEPDSGSTENSDPATALQKAEKELENARRQIKNLRRTLSESRRDFSAEMAKADRELRTLRMEHRELADLRELVFNRENTVRAKDTGEITFPYETKKRTVVFGGHDTFLKAIRPLLPDVKFVDTANYGFDPEIVRNSDVVWIQTNCISHSQYGNILRLTRQNGIQLRYFAYASAKECARQLVLEDRKE